MKNDRRNFLKVFGLSSAAVVGNSGNVEKVVDPQPEAHPRERAYGSWQWKTNYDVVSQVLYDRQALRHAGNRLKDRYNFFCDGWMGNRGPEDTNVYNPCRLDPPELYKISKAGITFDPGTSEKDKWAMIRSYDLKLWIGHKHFIHAPLVEACGWGPDPTCDFKTLFDLDIPLIMSWEDSFRMELSSRNPPEVEGEPYVWGVFHGQRARGVQ